MYGRGEILKQNKINLKAVFVGLLIAFLGSIFVGTLILMTVVLTTMILGVHIQDIVNSFSMRILLFVIGILINALGGYVAARISKFKEVKHALYVGIISGITGTFILIRSCNTLPSWYLISSIILVIPAAIFGGYYAKRVHENTKTISNF